MAKDNTNQEPKNRVGRPRTRTHEPEKSAQKGLKPGEERFNVVAKSSVIEDLKNIAHWERLLLKDITGKAFTEAIEAFKIEHPEYVQDGSIKPRPA